MILAYLLLLTGLTISSVAIYYSVAGLTAIFSAAAVPIMVMGISLEVAKLVCATWIKAYWARVPRTMRTYMVTAIIVLMMITSMGIFGFLSKAHNDQNLVSGDVQSRIAIYDEKIATARSNIESDRKQLKQMDEAVDQVMARSTSETGADKAVAIRRSQARDRTSLARDIEANQKIVSQLNDEAAPIRAEVRKVDAEVGPIKYIAAFIYGTTPDASMLEKAVTWVIIMIVVVFDPLAVIMLLASQMTFGWRKEIRQARARADDDGMVDSDPTIMPPPKTIFNVFADALEKRINDFHSVRERFKPKPKPVPAMVEPTLEVPDHVLTNIAEGSEFAVTDTPAMEPYVEPVEAFWEDPVTLDAIEQHALNEALREELLISETIPEPEGDIPVFEREEIPLEEEPTVEDEHPFRGQGLQPSMPLMPSYIQPKIVEEIQPEPASPFTFEMIDNEPAEEPVLITRIAFPESNLEVPQQETTWTPATQIDEAQAVQQLKDIGFLQEDGTPNPDYIPDEAGIAPEEEVKFYPMDERPGDYIEPAFVEAGPHPGRKSKVVIPAITADNDLLESKVASRSGFGNEFPANPNKGDTYLRTDYLPNRLFKFNDYKWIEVDKDSTDVYAYEEAYIRHLIEEIDAGRYDTDSLTDVEVEQIKQYLGKNAQ